MRLITIIIFLLLAKAIYGQKAKVEHLSNLPYDKYELKTKNDSITFYLSKTSKNKNLPLIVYV